MATSSSAQITRSRANYSSVAGAILAVMRNCAASYARVDAAAWNIWLAFIFLYPVDEAVLLEERERDELAKQRELKAINARLTQHEWKIRVTLFVVIVLNVVVVALLAYLLFGRV